MLGRHFIDGSLRRRLRAGETIFGLFIAEMRSPNMAMFVEAAGYDFAIFDMEHGSYTLAELATMIPGFHGCRCVPMLRVPAVRREYFQATLDLGIGGIVVPMVETADDARMCVELMKYPPAGRRGVAYCRPHAGFVRPAGDGFTDEANDNMLLVVQIESAKGLENAEEILSVPGVDVVFVGNADLGQSLGCSDNLEGGPIREAMERILNTAAAHHVVGGGNMVQLDLMEHFRRFGLRFITLTSEVERLAVGLQTAIQEPRAWASR
jgi:2-keto-3-deoxy-L-rhamnonate aldolase RhmA